MVTVTHDTIQSMDEWTSKIAAGIYPGAFFTRKFGVNPSVTTTEEDMWVFGGTKTWRSTAVTMYISGDDATATTQVFFVTGIGANYEVQQGLVTMNGQTQAAVTDLDGGAVTWIDIDRFYQVDAAAVPTGDIYIAETDTLTLGVPDTATKVVAMIEGTGSPNQTQQCMLQIPKNYIGLLYTAVAMLSQATGAARYADINVATQSLIRGHNPVAPTWAPFRHRDEMTVSTQGPVCTNHYKFPIVLDEMDRVKMAGAASAASFLKAQLMLLCVPKSK